MPFDIYTLRALRFISRSILPPPERVPGLLDLVRSAGRMLALCLIRAVGRAVFLEGHQLSCCCLLTARDEVRLAARSEGGGEAGSGVASVSVSRAASGEPLRAACGAPPPRPGSPPTSGKRRTDGRNGNGPSDGLPPTAPASPSAARWAGCPDPAPAPNQTRRKTRSSAARGCGRSGSVRGGRWIGRDAAAAAHAAAEATRRPRRQARPAEAGET